MAKKGISLQERTANKLAKAKEDRAKKKAEQKRKQHLATKQKANLKYKARKLQEREQQLKEWEADSESLKDLFIDILTTNNGQLGISLKQAGLDRSWYRKMITTDKDFQQRVHWIYEDLEESYMSKLYSDAMEGNIAAGYAYSRRLKIVKANLTYQARIQEIRDSDDISLDKSKALKFAVKELMITYYSMKALGQDIQALKAIKQYVEVLQLTEVSDMADFEVMTGTKLIQIMGDLNIQAPDMGEVDLTDVPDNMKDIYKDMLPTQKLDGNNEQ